MWRKETVSSRWYKFVYINAFYVEWKACTISIAKVQAEEYILSA